MGKKQTVQHDSIYFEIYEPFFQQSVRMGDWKGYRLGTNAPLELYELKSDPSEKHNVASLHPEILQQIELIMAREHTTSPHYDAPDQGNAGGEKTRRKKASSSESSN